MAVEIGASFSVGVLIRAQCEALETSGTRDENFMAISTQPQRPYAQLIAVGTFFI